MSVSKGLTLIEVIIVIGIIALLASFTGFSLIRSRNTVSLDGVTATIANEIKSQQLNSMNGYTQAGVVNPYYGIYFENNRYILFHTLTYQNDAQGNYPVDLDSDNRFSVINLPYNQIVFASQSGEISNYDPVRNFVSVENVNSSQEKTLYFNHFGVVYDTN
jgi:prepilin-type N-terminal cleavage/methylation domain-containing protein